MAEIKSEQVPYNVTREALTAWMGSEGTIMSAMERAVAAAINAWPGMHSYARYVNPFDKQPEQSVIILPLPAQEPRE
jgi:hypothetical protein